MIELSNFFFVSHKDFISTNYSQRDVEDTNREVTMESLERRCLLVAWIIVLAIAAVLGWITSLAMRRVGMGPIVCIPVAVIGAILGGVIHYIYDPVSTLAFYGLSLLLSVLALGGSIYAFFLTGAERRA